MVEGQEHVVDDSSIPRNDEHNIPDTRLEPRSDKESPEAEFTNVVIPVVYEEEDEITNEELQGCYGYLFEHLRAKFMPRKSFVTLADHLHKAMTNSLPTMVDKQKNKEEMEKMIAKAILQEQVSLNVDEAKLKKIADEMLRQRCTLGYEHQYHIDQMKNFLKSDIVWESHKEIHVPPHPRKTTPIVLSWPKKIVLSLHKFPAVVFNNDDIEEQTSRWVNKCVNNFNPYARYGVKHWKNPHAKIFYIRKQKEPGKPKEFITEISARRANECIVSITEPDFKNLNKNDIKDMYLLIMNGKVPDYAETGLLWYLSVFIRSSVIWERVHDFQLGIESYQ
nr:hypothetical protein [Tanacetum cinerariifolium]